MRNFSLVYQDFWQGLSECFFLTVSCMKINVMGVGLLSSVEKNIDLKWNWHNLAIFRMLEILRHVYFNSSNSALFFSKLDIDNLQRNGTDLQRKKR